MAMKEKLASSKQKKFCSSHNKQASISSLATCKLCSKFFTDPRLLPCLHSFCFKCLKDEIKNCPTCKKAFEQPNGGLSALPKDLRKQYEVEVAEYGVKIDSSSDIACDRCLDSSENNATSFCCNCCKFLCSKCKEDHTRHREKYQHELVDIGQGKVSTKSLLESIPHKKVTCQFHSDEVLKFFCETCCQLVCRDCIILKHNKHKYDRVEEVVENGKKELLSSVSEADSFANKLETSATDGGKMIKKIQSKKKSVEEDIRSEFKKLHDALDAREKCLLARNLEVHLEKETALKLQQESTTILKQNIRQLVSKINETLSSYTPVELLSAQTSMMEGLKDIKKEYRSFSIELCKNDSVILSFATISLLTDLEHFGYITAGCYARNSAISLMTSELIQGKEKALKITTRDKKGEPYQQGGENVVAYLSPLGSDETATFKGKDNKDGSYTLQVTPQVIGEHSLDIRIGNESIQSNPFLVYVRSSRNFNNLTILCNISISSGYPNDVAVSGNKLFIVSSGSNIMVADKESGTLLEPITCQSEHGQIGYNAFAIAAQDDILYVTDQQNNCVHKLTRSGKYLAKIGSIGSGDGQLQNPRGLCLSWKGELYVSEMGNNRISVFKTDGTFDRHIKENMYTPWGIAIDPTGNLHVANYQKNYITVHSLEGCFIRQYGSGHFVTPIGITVTGEGFLVVAEYNYQQSPNYAYDYKYSSRLAVFDQNFNHVTTKQDIYQGYGVTCDRDGFIYVCDYQNRRVLKY